MNFDLANACLGFVNGMHVAATMIDAGHIDYALVVDGEDARAIAGAHAAPAERDPTSRSRTCSASSPP